MGLLDPGLSDLPSFAGLAPLQQPALLQVGQEWPLGGVVAQPVSTHGDEGQSPGSPGREGHMTAEVAAVDDWRPGWRRNVLQRPPWHWALDGSRRTPSSPHAGPSRG